MVKYCDFCGTSFETTNPRRLYCCAACRRKADNERKAERRAEESELREDFCMPDDWVQNDLGEDIIDNSLTDGWTKECEICADEALGGPMACQQCPHYQAMAKSRKKDKPELDLLCSMCRDGVKV